MNKENCALKLVDEIIQYYDALSKKTSNLKSESFDTHITVFIRIMEQ